MLIDGKIPPYEVFGTRATVQSGICGSGLTETTKWGRPAACGGLSSRLPKLALRELEALAGALLPVFLALMLAGIPRQHAQFLQLCTQLDIELEQGARNP